MFVFSAVVQPKHVLGAANPLTSLNPDQKTMLLSSTPAEKRLLVKPELNSDDQFRAISTPQNDFTAYEFGKAVAVPGTSACL